MFVLSHDTEFVFFALFEISDSGMRAAQEAADLLPVSGTGGTFLQDVVTDWVTAIFQWSFPAEVNGVGIDVLSFQRPLWCRWGICNIVNTRGSQNLLFSGRVSAT
jgi:hypothetical protein